MTQEEWSVQSKSIDALLEFCKQQLIIAGILIGLSVTLNANLVPKTSIESRTVLIIAWFLLFGSIIFGLLLLGRASYVIGDISKVFDDRLNQLRLFGLGQIFFLGLGVILLLIAVGPHLGG